MAGSILTAVTSSLLMGGALHAALDGRQDLAKPARLLGGETVASAATVAKGDRPAPLVALEPVSEQVLQVPTVTRVGTRNVIRKRPFAYAEAPLAIAPEQLADYPKFDPLAVFRDSGIDKAAAISSDVIYGADIESEVAVETVAFPYQPELYARSTVITDREAQASVREAARSLSDGETMVTALAYLDTDRFALDDADNAPTTALDIRIVAENVSDARPEDFQGERDFRETVVVKRSGQTLGAALAGLSLKGDTLASLLLPLSGDLSQRFDDDGVDERLKLRVVYEEAASDGTAVALPGVARAKPARTARRISAYRQGVHIASHAMNDDDRVVKAAEPAPIPAIAADDVVPDETVPRVANKNLPNIYDGLYRAAMSQGLNAKQARKIVRTVAFDVNFRTKASPTDRLEIFYSLDDGETEASGNSEVLFIGLTIGQRTHSYYRFKTGEDGQVGYFDRDGKSSRKFLLRNPVPNGKFRSAFGPRRHPISRRVKMHQGVDFSAPRGTPIVAAGNGTVIKTGWAGGYGRQTLIRHANGYETSYNHQHRYARGIKAGARVRLGQVIGTVGSSGYSTGPHLHYEVKVNGRRVNPMKIRLPQGKVLKGEELANFKRERDRIDALLDKGRGKTETVASLN